MKLTGIAWLQVGVMLPGAVPHSIHSSIEIRTDASVTITALFYPFIPLSVSVCKSNSLTWCAQQSFETQVRARYMLWLIMRFSKGVKF